jgi:lipopolysaccharide biosynthesis glycosyltransferase
MLWMAGYPKRKPRIKCEKCSKHYIPSEQIMIMCGYFKVENPWCKWCLKNIENLTLEQLWHNLKRAEEAFDTETDPTKKQELKKTFEDAKKAIEIYHLKEEKRLREKELK